MHLSFCINSLCILEVANDAQVPSRNFFPHKNTVCVYETTLTRHKMARRLLLSPVLPASENPVSRWLGSVLALSTTIFVYLAICTMKVILGRDRSSTIATPHKYLLQLAGSGAVTHCTGLSLCLGQPKTGARAPKRPPCVQIREGAVRGVAERLLAAAVANSAVAGDMA